jgi:hypothetical protein
VEHNCNSSTQEAESSRSAWATQQGPVSKTKKTTIIIKKNHGIFKIDFSRDMFRYIVKRHGWGNSTMT